MKVKFIIETDMLRNPKQTIKIINDSIRMITGDVWIEAPEGYLKKEDLE